jgi:hypothetical protein
MWSHKLPPALRRRAVRDILLYGMCGGVLIPVLRSQHSITLKSLQQLCPVPVKFAELKSAIEGRWVGAG